MSAGYESLRGPNDDRFQPWRRGLDDRGVDFSRDTLNKRSKKRSCCIYIMDFLGGIGMHNFYIGRIMLRICEAILCLLGFIFILAAGLGVIFLVPLAVLLFIDLFIIPDEMRKSLNKKGKS